MSLTDEMLMAIEDDLSHQITCYAGQPFLHGLRDMMAYHLGWEGKGAGPEARGKRIRPLLVTLCAAASGGDWHHSLPSASAVELVHNFSLIHDDIEDNSPLRRGRPTVWKLWGIPQAINTGDAMFSLAHLAILNLQENLTFQVVQHSCQVLQQTCLTLTQGQFLDISFEARNDVSLDDYWRMIGGKTAALLSCSCALGALAGGATKDVVDQYASFGRNLGFAFQALDDILGIWGNATFTGKSAESDLVTGKKTLPILYGLNQAGEFSIRWPDGKVVMEDIAIATSILKDCGAEAYTRQQADQFTENALNALEKAMPVGQARIELENLANVLLQRKN